MIETESRAQVRTRERHERILDAALDVIVSRGYQATAVSDIATAADTSKGGVYFHFPGKDAIFLALIDRSARLLRERVIARIGAETDPTRRLDAALGALVDVFGTHRRLTRLFLVETPGAGPRFYTKTLELHGDFIEIIAAELDAAVAAGTIAPHDTRLIAQAWFGAINEVVSQWAVDTSPHPLGESLPGLRGLLLRGVGMAVS
ncbi:MAG: TetR/AcrR family transcriptional regulator [Chloroflexota bacterium]|nr:MAG: TetR/AcrR family transcriptional regulator [Chloroflexota bacterium]